MPKLAKSPLAPAAFPELPATIQGIRFASVAAGLRYRQRHDLTLIECAPGSAVAGVFTRSTTAGHPVLWCRRALAAGRARGILVNAGNANVFLGGEGDRAVMAEVEAVASALGCQPEEVFVASTGVIGERLPYAKIVEQVPHLVQSLNAEGIETAAQAIMTTDTFPKGAAATTSVDGHEVKIAGIAKGSGMIAPDMATMLAFVFTDAALPTNVLNPLLHHAANRTFNSITVDSDTSTSDTFLLVASGQAEHPAIKSADDPKLTRFAEALETVCQDLALQIVRDGEGAQKLITITVRGARDEPAARRMALAIGNSPLVKTAIAGGDANWGRVIMAIGKTYEPIDTGKLAVRFGGIDVARNGAAVPDLDEGPVAAHLNGREIVLDVIVGDGPGQARVWTCDLTHQYIDINADYRS